MKILLVGINASYSHTCLAVRSICEYVKKHVASKLEVAFTEFTINQPVGEILRGIYEQEPSIILFSTYIWNAELTTKIIPDIKKLLPSVLIGAGGPEFGFAAELYLKKLPELDFIIKGEGEQTTAEIVEAIAQPDSKSFNRTDTGRVLRKLSAIKGLYLRDDDGSVTFTSERELICDLSELPFPYPELITATPSSSDTPSSSATPSSSSLETINKNKIYYYESSRGCPYSCAYCMSSLDKRVRFKPLELVFQELQIFLDNNIPLVKFVDRTYNLQPDRYIAIWRYILEHHNKLTMFHFEIEAEFLTDEALEFLQTVPSGVMQFEIGVQSANKKSLSAVSRSTNIEKLADNIRRIPRTIHQHLDLIAGLPYENLESFGKSFDFVMSFAPDAIQLGFLKVLHGTQMEQYAKQNGWQWMENPVYETFSTPYMSYKDMLFLKDLEVLTDAFWNKELFSHTMKYIGHTLGFWNFFKLMTESGEQQGVFEAARRETFWFEFLSTNIAQLPKLNPEILYDLLRYDFVLRGKQGNWPSWYKHNYDKERHRTLLEEAGALTNARLDFGHSEYEVFSCNVDDEYPEKNTGNYEKLVRYNLK
ncbi:MAG: DUF4080 domain-containing protein [Treponema sp.]|nr:DUF4080 domain-containing protein [Treponema sp.]